MLRFSAKNFMAVMVNVERISGTMLAYPDMGDHRPEVTYHLAHVYNELRELPVSKSLLTQALRTLEAPDDINVTVLRTRVSELLHNIGEELASHTFFCVRSEERRVGIECRPVWS